MSLAISAGPPQAQRVLPPRAGAQRPGANTLAMSAGPPQAHRVPPRGAGAQRPGANT